MSAKKTESRYEEKDEPGWHLIKVSIGDGRFLVTRRPKNRPEKVYIELHTSPTAFFQLQVMDLDQLDILQELLTYTQLRVQTLAEAEAEAIEADDSEVDEDYANLR